MHNYKKKFIEFIFRVGALQFGSFTLKNGKKSPYFFNSSKFNNGSLIDELGLYYALTIEANFPKCNLIFGPSYKGIPLCISSAIALSKRSNHDIGYFFNRKEEKNYGDHGVFIGQSPLAKDSIVMVDDVITDGHTKIENIKLIRKVCKAEVKGVIVSLDRMEKNSKGIDSINQFHNSTGIPAYPIVTIREIFDYLINDEFDGSIKLADKTFNIFKDYLLNNSI